MFILYYWKDFFKYTGKKLWVVILLSPIVGILDAVGLTLIIPLALNLISGDEGQEGNFVGDILADFGLQFSSQQIFYIILFVFAGKLIFRYIHLILSSSISANFVKQLRSQLIKLITKLDYRHYTSIKTGHLINNATYEAIKFSITQKAYVEAISFLCILCGYAVLIVLNSWKSGLILALLGIAFGQIYRFLNSVTKGFSRSIIIHNQEHNSKLIEMVNYFKYLKSTARFDFFGKKLNVTINQSARIQYKSTLVGGIPTVIQEIVVLTMIGILWALNHFFVHEPLEVILIILAMGYRASGTMSQFQSRKNTFYSGVGSIEAIKKLVKEFTTFGEREDIGNRIDFSKSLALDGIGINISNKEIIRGVSLTIEANKIVAFVGSSGAGKTTLIDVIAGVLKPDTGRILIDGNSFSDLATDRWRKQIGYITQECMIFDGSVLENITMDAQPNNKKALEQALEWSRCNEFVPQLLDGLDTQLGERGVKLSGGQRQRIAIARELYKMPSLLIMDEATSSLDTESEKIIQQSIDSLRGKITTIIVAHRLSTIKSADMIYVLDQGKVVEYGNFDTLTSNPNSTFFKMAELQELV